MSTTESKSIPTVTLMPLTGFVNDKSQDGWKLIEDTPIEGNPELELTELLKEGESPIQTNAVFDRTKNIDNLAGQQHAERLMAQLNTIPEEWRKFDLLFPGTKWHSFAGPLFIPWIEWHRQKWCLCWFRSNKWNSKSRIVRYI